MNIKIVSILDAIALMIFAVDMGTYFFEINFFLRYLPFLLGLNFIVFIAARSKDYINLSIALTIIFLCCMTWNQDTSLNISSILINISLGLYLYLRHPNRKAISFLIPCDRFEDLKIPLIGIHNILNSNKLISNQRNSLKVYEDDLEDMDGE